MTEHTELAADIEEAVAALGLPPGWDLRVEIRPRRSTVGLQLTPGEPVKVLVPPHATPERVADVIRHHWGWLAQKIPEARRLAPDFAVKTFVNGEGFYLLGRSYRLHLTDDGPPTRIERLPHVLGTDEFLCVRRDRLDAMCNAVIALYCDRGMAWAREHGEQYEHHANIQGLRYEVRSLGRRRWGSYSPTKHLVSLHWPVFGLPQELIEYVLVHELAHATRPAGRHHGPAWQRQMSLWMPDWRQRKAALAQVGRRAWMGDYYQP
ncbi:M48 family metallopeptidase [Saccharopolyspora sp. K220]|uniref:M48 family metallopeptidase n=1 Tax=Saccharopolyspora soli TaxID=2926618 RepID=UPI001F5798E7|nr:YgjP-like metallopeptidase domain-containing protein [Saccharopolyspora soli]MCI2420063.1 M48 family metallopeptidase [Saccharopolyspora soli]